MIYISDVIHKSDPAADILHPEWDSMICLRNTANVTLNAVMQLWNEADGSLMQWPGLGDRFSVALQPGLLWAASFLPNNGFGSTPPQDFQGHAAIEVTSPTPFGAKDHTDDVLPFMLAAFKAWHFGVSLPWMKDLQPRSLWQLAYAIPQFDDRSGATAAQWTVGVSVQNFSPSPVNAALRYVVAQTYAEKGQNFDFPFTIPANGGVRFDLMAGNPTQNVPGLRSAGYPSDLNSEGHLDITTPAPALLACSAIVASSDYTFMVKEEFQ